MIQISQATLISRDAAALLSHMRTRYIEDGYMYSGNVTPTRASVLLFDGDINRADRAFYELEDVGAIRIRDCQQFCYELTAQERWGLIQQHGLAQVWQQKAPEFYPCSEHGEVTSVKREIES